MSLPQGKRPDYSIPAEEYQAQAPPNYYGFNNVAAEPGGYSSQPTYAQQPGGYGYTNPGGFQYQAQYAQPPPDNYYGGYGQQHPPPQQQFQQPQYLAGIPVSGVPQQGMMGHHKPQGGYYDEEAGGYKPSYEEPGSYVANAEEIIRKGFMRKVYGILLIQILATIAVSCLFMYNETANRFVLTTPSLLLVGLGLSLVTLFALICNRHKYPLNMILLSVWTLVEAYTVGVVCASYAAQGAGGIVLQAFIITGVIFIGLTLFTLQSKINFGPLGMFLGVALFGMLAWGIIVSILGWQISFIFSLIGAIVFSLYIVYDTWLLSKVLDPNDYILGAVNLYLDVLNLFLCILRLLGGSDNRD